MIVTRTPLRISLLGGGSDLPQYYSRNPGVVISTSINKYIQIALNRCDTNHCRVVYSEMEVTDDANDIKHDRVRETLKHFDIKSNIEICSFSQVSTKGTGLGSSSTFTVGLIKALYTQLCLPHNKRDLAELACEIEIDRCNEPIGKQDQYAAAYGGFNIIRFYSDGVEVTPLNVRNSVLLDLNENLMCFSTGMTRKTSDILTNQVKNLKSKETITSTDELVLIAEQGIKYLRKEKIDDFGALLHESWMRKRKLASGITNDHLDSMYDTAMSAGALGGKVLGAGGGGYMLFYVPKDRRDIVRRAMEDFKQFHFRFTDFGSEATVL